MPRRRIEHDEVVRRFGEQLREVRRSRGMTQAELVPAEVNPPDPDGVLQAQVRGLADALARTADRDTLLLAAQLLARLSRADR
jgi:hypothetical protein